MINLAHAGYELHYSMNLTNPCGYDEIYHKERIEQIKWFIVSLPKYSGRVYKKDYPQEKFWLEVDVYMTYYKGHGRVNKGDRMVCFYMKEKEIDIHNIDWGEDSNPPIEDLI